MTFDFRSLYASIVGRSYCCEYSLDCIDAQAGSPISFPFRDPVNNGWRGVRVAGSALNQIDEAGNTPKTSSHVNLIKAKATAAVTPLQLQASS